MELEIEYRTVSRADAQQIMEFLGPFMDDGFLLHREPLEIEKLAEHGYAAYNQGQLIGFAAVEIYSRKLAELQCLAVSKDYRRLGIGRKLVQWCCELAKKIGVKELMAISSTDEMFVECGFGYSLPDQKRALFYRPD